MTMRALFAGLTLACLMALPQAHAQSARMTKAKYCAQLEGELARLQRAKHSRSNRNFQKYDAAVHKQQSQLDRANQLAKRDACLGRRGFLFRRTPKPTCPALLKRIKKMERNLNALEKKRARYAPPPTAANAGAQKARILRELGNASCGPQYARFARAEPVRERRGLFGTIFRSRDSGLSRQWGDVDVPEIGTYRTVCVRACDGFFFPISFSTTKSNFGRDDGICQARCPGAAVELYVYQNPGETPEDMKSIGGRSYNSLETAFLYQKEYVPNCSCQAPASQLATVAGETQLPNSPANSGAPVTNQPTGPTVPLPLPKQSAMIDPDTRAAERLGVPFTPYKPPEVRSEKGVVRTADGRSIRIVGPKFFGSQE